MPGETLFDPNHDTRADGSLDTPEAPTHEDTDQLPRIVTHGWAPLLGRVVRGDDDIDIQRGLIERRQNREGRYLPAATIAKNLDNIQKIRDEHGIDRASALKAQRLAQSQREDEARRKMPPPPKLPTSSVPSDSSAWLHEKTRATLDSLPVRHDPAEPPSDWLDDHELPVN